LKYKIIKGIKCYNPEIIDSFSNYPESGFNLNQDHKKSFFWARSRNRVFKKILTQETIGLDNANFLEVGCNNGSFIKYISDVKKFKITGSEIYLKGIILAKKYIPNVEFLQLDITKTRLKARHFDVIAAFDVLEHISEDTSALSNIHKMLHDNGKLILSVPQYNFLWSEIDELVHHQRRYNKKDLMLKLKNTGFKVDFISSYVFILFPLMLFSRSFNFLFFKSKKRPEEKLSKMVTFPKFVNIIFDFLMRVDEYFISLRLSLPFGGTLVVIASKQI
jgi:2-polyprenyl-3-methyl-5-hydroxy-6-metoxy-1,4-benzoquinol methylase